MASVSYRHWKPLHAFTIAQSILSAKWECYLAAIASSNILAPANLCQAATIHLTIGYTKSKYIYRQTYNLSRTLVGNNIVDHSDVDEASPVGAAPTTSSLSI